MLLLATSIALVITRPRFMTLTEACVVLGLNVMSFVSTFRWQRRLQSEMAETGYDAAKIRVLISTNWIRAGAYLAQGAIAALIVARALARAVS